MGQGGGVSDETQPTSLADLHADLLGRLATGGDSDLLARACRALANTIGDGHGDGHLYGDGLLRVRYRMHGELFDACIF